MNVVKFMTYWGYWHLYRVVDGRHFLGHIDHRIGPTIKEVSEDQIKDVVDQLPSDDIYTTEQIQTFGNLSLTKLEEWVARGT
jgi:hypothetical protein